jgi:hypothetical protein
MRPHDRNGLARGLVSDRVSRRGGGVVVKAPLEILAEGISEAMNCTVYAFVIWLSSTIILSVMMRKRPAPSE